MTMLSWSTLLISFLAASLLGHEVQRCGTAGPTTHQLEDAKVMHQEEQALEVAGKPSEYDQVTIDTVFHVLLLPSKPSDVPKQMLNDQLAIMQNLFRPSGFSFNLINTTRTINKDWAGGPGNDTMYRTLRQGSYATLNIYIHAPMTGILGLTFFPKKNAPPGSHAFIWDGVSIAGGSLPGGDIENFHQGKTAVHEIGHWLHLMHTFENGCKAPGDFIGDTPPERKATVGCPTGKDSCPGRPGLDPIHNYMDYSSCMNQFTPNQAARMHTAWEKYRAGRSTVLGDIWEGWGPTAFNEYIAIGCAVLCIVC